MLKDWEEVLLYRVYERNGHLDASEKSITVQLTDDLGWRPTSIREGLNRLEAHGYVSIRRDRTNLKEVKVENEGKRYLKDVRAAVKEAIRKGVAPPAGSAAKQGKAAVSHPAALHLGGDCPIPLGYFERSVRSRH